MDLTKLINEYEDFPTKGVLFRDISPLLRDHFAWKEVLTTFKKEFLLLKPNVIAGIESRGFIIGSALAREFNIGFVPIRKKGKLPGNLIGIDYSLEYGIDRLEIQEHSFSENERVLLVDDLLATGGTASAAINLINKTKANLIGLGFVIELSYLKGRERINKDIPIKSIINYD